jgi:4-diphosphocytidyl-2-C-methyl-D-erythritol kinase
MKVAVRCSAKINLYLDILGKREDGFHEIETVFQPVSLFDNIEIATSDGSIIVTGTGASVPWNEENLCHRAATALFRRMEYGGGAAMHVTKSIPPGAGLGGGSSDAAAVLIGLNELLRFGLTRSELIEIATGIGSDVPFFIFGKPAIGRGRGEQLEEIEGLPGGWIVIAKPETNVSTSWAYRNLKLMLTRKKRAATLTALTEGLKTFPAAKLETCNSFEEVVVRSFPEIGGILTILRGEEPILCAMSGSGSACFAVFSEENRAKEVSEKLIEKGVFVNIARPVHQAIELLQSGQGTSY